MVKTGGNLEIKQRLVCVHADRFRDAEHEGVRMWTRDLRRRAGCRSEAVPLCTVNSDWRGHEERLRPREPGPDSIGVDVAKVPAQLLQIGPRRFDEPSLHVALELVDKDV